MTRHKVQNHLLLLLLLLLFFIKIFACRTNMPRSSWGFLEASITIQSCCWPELFFFFIDEAEAGGGGEAE